MKRVIALLALLIGYLLLDTLVISQANIPYYNEILNPIIWIILCVIAVLFSKDTGFRVRDEKNKIQSIIICMIVYIIIYFLLGLIFGFQRTPYSKKIFNIIKNIWAFGGIIVFQEIVRYSLIKLSKKNVFALTATVIVFVFLSISLANFSGHFSSLKDGFTYTASTLIPAIVASAVLTYLSYIGGAVLPIIYRLVILLPEFIVPIVPDLDWFATALVGIVTPLAVFVYMNYVHVAKAERLSRRARKKYSPVIYVPVFVLIAVLAGFVVGVFKYQPVAIVSGSMSPTFNRGDAVVIEKLDDKEKKTLKKGDIIQFTSGNKYVVHRINKVTNDNYGNAVYITKGDANNTTDSGEISAKDITGKYKFHIPYIGYPSVWLSDVIS